MKAAPAEPTTAPWCSVHAAPGCLKSLAKKMHRGYAGRTCAGCPAGGRPESVATHRAWEQSLLDQAYGMPEDQYRALLRLLPAFITEAVREWGGALVTERGLARDAAQRAVRRTLIVEAMRRRCLYRGSESGTTNG